MTMHFQSPGRRITFLMGGLGNQLFQIARGLHGLDSSDSLLCIYIRGITKLNSMGIPEASGIFSTTSDKVRYQEYQPNYFQLKLIKFSIRVSAASAEFSLLKKIAKLLAGFALQILISRGQTFFIANGVGYCGVGPTKQNVCLVGYFQSYAYSAAILRVLDGEKESPIELGTKAKSLFLEAKRVQPIIAHVRLGDYALNAKFGTLSENYYREAFSIFEKDSTSPIYWVFSDEPEEAKKLFQKLNTKDLRFIDDKGLTSIEILQIMREGKEYIIGNSTFSYWAALLSRNNNARVIAPSKWFKELPTPTGLYPPHWQLVGENCALFN